MSYTVRRPTAAAVSASISTPVGPRHSTFARMRRAFFSSSKSTATRVRPSGWASGMRSAVRFAAWMAARRATPSTSPLAARPPLTSATLAGRMRMRPEATAMRCVCAFSPTSTMSPAPCRSKWVSFMAGYHKRMRLCAFFLIATLAALPRALAQALPDLGSAGDVTLTAQVERRIGESIVRDIRFRDPAYLDDPEIVDYLSTLGGRLAQANPAARQDFECVAMREHTINAFALPGGFVGVHSGLLSAAETESELASVLAHEIGHVSQRHIARMLGQQQQLQMPVLAALAAAILLGRARPDLATGAAVAAQAGAVQASLSYSRDFEREADRVGMQTLEAAGFDARAMAAFFEKLQRATRVSDDGTLPGYLRTHPVTVERIADAQNKAAAMPYRQHVDSIEFQLVRAKLRAEAGDARDAVAHFQSSVREQRYASEAAARYGLAAALLRAGEVREAQAEMAPLRGLGVASAMIELLDARIKQLAGDAGAASALLARAKERYPDSRAVV